MKIFDTISKNSSLSVEAFFICLGVALIVGIVFSYLCSFKMRSSKRFFVTIAMLPSIVTLVVAFVNREIGTGIAIAGAFSLVRFRSAQGSAEEIVVVFVAMAGGLAFGTGYIAYGVIFLLVMGLVYLALEYTNIWSHKKQKEERILKVTIPEDLSYATVFDDLFKKYTTSHELVGVKTTNMGSMFRLSYRIVVKDINQEKNFVDELRERNGNLEIAIERTDFERVTL